MSAEVSHDHGKAPKGKKNAPEPAPPPKTWLEGHNSAFLVKSETGVRLDKAGQRTGEIDENKFLLNEDDRKQYYNFLKHQAEGLKRLQDANPKLFAKEKFAFQRDLLEALTDEHGNLPDPLVSSDTDTINKFLKTPDGWKIANMMLEESISYELFAEGLVEETNKPPSQQARPGKEPIYTGKDQGRINKILRSAAWGKITGTTAGAAVAAVGAGAGAVIGDAIEKTREGVAAYAAAGGGISLATIGAVYGAVRLGESATKSGEVFTTKESIQGLEYIQGDRDLREYVKHVYQIHVDNYVVNRATNKVDIKPGVKAIGRTGPEIRKEIDAKLATRSRFYEAIGVDVSQLDRMPESFLLQYDASKGVPTTGTDIDARLGKYYNVEKDIKDSMGRSQNHADFMQGGATLDVPGNIKRYHKARTKVMTEMMQEYIHSHGSDGSAGAGDHRKLDEKITARDGTDTEFRLQATKKERDTKAAIDDTLTSLQTERTTVDTYSTQVNELDKLKALKERELKIPVGDIDTQISNLTTEIDTLNTTIDSLETNRENEKATARAVYDPVTSAKEKAPAQKAATEMSESNTDRAIKRAQEAIKLKEEKRTKLQEAKAEIAEKEAALIESQSTVINYEQSVRSFQDAFTHVEDPTHVGIGAADLQTKTIDQLLAEANAKFATAPPAGWPPEQNNDRDKRMLLVNASIHARAEMIAARDPARLTDTRRAALFEATITRWGTITENQWRSLSTNEINLLANKARQRGGIGRGWEAGENDRYVKFIARMKEEANLRHISRVSAMEQVKKDLEDASNAQEKLIKEKKFTKELDILIPTRDLVARQGEVYRGAKMIVAKENAERFGNTKLVTPTDRDYSQAERDFAKEVAYYEYLDVLFDYKSRDDREQYFNKIKEILPPDKLADLLNTGLKLNLRMVSMPEVVKKIAAKRKKGGLNKTQMRKALEGVIDRLKDEALSLP